jgi:hypothetical protein
MIRRFAGKVGSNTAQHYLLGKLLSVVGGVNAAVKALDPPSLPFIFLVKQMVLQEC